MKNTYKIKNINDYNIIIDDIKSFLKKDNIISLKGTLGSGKTTFTQELLKYMGYIDVVSSPTFAIANTYNINNLKVNHIDAYRLQSYEEFLNDYINEDSLCIIEWYEKLKINDNLLDLELEFDVINENERIINVRSINENFASNTST